MKITLIVLIAASVVMAAPVEESSVKEKRGLALGLGYHAPLLPLSTSHLVAPTVYHSAPLLQAAPIVHAPILTHSAPIITSHAISHSILPSYHLPAISTLHHYK
ncbi:uncharacterized protein LOC105665357 [Ceratitis capitata]|uniref:(Mediterranean fruit fly) hypothetical protein n=1 Tax=Ceratitis capitata TaxID=7213 RepID=A0A811VKY6_CERCA|nr:uncharacterized protein LOC105665357 [Ceratitis capitata]CAD7014752.1 unnamed protein product [Ceratitis capitata]